MLVPCPFALHVGYHSLYYPIREIGNGAYIVGIKISDFYTVFVTIHAQEIQSAHVGHMYCDTHIQAVLPCDTNTIISQGKHQLFSPHSNHRIYQNILINSTCIYSKIHGTNYLPMIWRMYMRIFTLCQSCRLLPHHQPHFLLKNSNSISQFYY